VSVDQDVVVLEIEDLVPIDTGHRAALNYLARFRQLEGADSETFSRESIVANLPRFQGRVWDSISTAYGAAFPDEHIEKAGWAREIISLLGQDPSVPGADALRERFGSLLRKLAQCLDDAAIEEEAERSDDRLKRIVKNFELNHSNGISKHDAAQLLRRLDAALGDSRFRDSLAPKLQHIGQMFELEDLSAPRVPRFGEFRNAKPGIWR
jgi:hypothetical protein